MWRELPQYGAAHKFSAATDGGVECHLRGAIRHCSLPPRRTNIAVGVARTTALNDGSEQDRESKALSDQEARYRTMMEEALDGILIGQDGVITDVNEPLLARSGYALHELIGHPVTDFVAEEFRDTVRQRQNAAVDGRFDAVAILKDGRRLRIELVTKNFEIRGRAVRITAVRDVTERRQARDALRLSERKLSAAARLARLGYWEDDVRGDRITWSEETCHVLGLPLTDRTRTWSEFVQLVHPDDRQAIEQRCGKMQRGEHGFRATFRLTLPEGGIRYVETMSEAVRDENGRTVRAVGAIQDVTELLRAKEAVRGSQERLQLALQVTGLGPWDWDLATNIVEFWPEWKRQIGYEPDEIQNRYEEWENRLHSDDRNRVLSALQAYLDGREAEYALEFRLRHKNGTYRWIYTRGVVLRDASGRQTHMIGCHLDITDRRQLEEQYRQSQKMQAIGQLAGGIAHDFNNSLIVINGYAELVAQELGPSHRSQRDLDEILAAGRSAANLTRHLLAFSRRQILQPQVLDLNQVLRRMQRLLDPAIGEDITLVMNLSAVGRVRADPGQIEQVILNLAVNARDAMPNGGRLLIETADAELDADYVAQHRGATVGRHVLLAVTDNGTGMDDETRAHLFEPFFTTKPAGRGTGLGLVTVYGIVKQGGGSIWVTSEPGTGSTFKIYLPVATGIEPATLPIETQMLRGTETVLVLEDQAEVRASIEKILRRYGYSSVVAANGPGALAAARAYDGPIDLMLADVVLPGASGREIARQVVADRPSVRVLYMSGYTQEAIHHHGVVEQGLAFIQKPFTGGELVRKIREVLDADQPPGS
jgi:two-component system cell cycle sensor histidine kinase/response regulator CckA